MTSREWELRRHLPVAMALLAALLFGLNAPLSKMILTGIPPMYMVAALYLGAGAGMAAVRAFTSGKGRRGSGLGRRELPWTLAMILLDVIAPFLLMWGLKLTTASNASLLSNLEMVATSLVAAAFFGESVKRRLWVAIGIITTAGALLSIDPSNGSAWTFSKGSLLVAAASLCWGVENNCTRKLSVKSPAEIVVVKGLGSGLTALAIALLKGEPPPGSAALVAAAILLGFVSYGLSIYFYVKAQRYLGAARTSAYYATAPFIGVLLSVALLGERLTWHFGVAAVVMMAGVWLALGGHPARQTR
jgi:drug/metabolite transporter (DMT)-like permease